MDADFPCAHSMDTRWFAIDEMGHLGVFETGEDGHLPEEAACLSPYSGEGEDLALALWRLRHPDQADAEDTFWEMEEEEIAEDLGVFFYGYEGGYMYPVGTYSISATPKTSLHVDQLPPELRKHWKRLRFHGVDFSRTRDVQPLEHGPCMFWDEDGSVAYVCSDGKTIRPVPGREDRFTEFCKEFREENPEEARKMIFDASQENPNHTTPPQGEKNGQ